MQINHSYDERTNQVYQLGKMGSLRARLSDPGRFSKIDVQQRPACRFPGNLRG